MNISKTYPSYLTFIEYSYPSGIDFDEKKITDLTKEQWAHIDMFKASKISFSALYVCHTVSWEEFDCLVKILSIIILCTNSVKHFIEMCLRIFHKTHSLLQIQVATHYPGSVTPLCAY